MNSKPTRRKPAPASSDTATLPASVPSRRSAAFLLAYALANAGGVLGYLPLLTLLLPIKVGMIAGDARLAVFTATIIVGTVAASAANILFGWLSDRTLERGGGRRSWMAAGLAGTAVAYALISIASTPAAIIIAVAAFQIAINALLAPLLAIMADEIPDEQKGVVSGLLLVANPIASMFSTAIIGVGMLEERSRLIVVVMAIVVCTLPLMLTRVRPVSVPVASAKPAGAPRDILIAWAARLMMQIAGSVMSMYLLYYFQSVAAMPDDPMLPVHVGKLLTIAFILPIPFALIVGRLSDRVGRRKPFLFAAALLGASGLMIMSVADHWSVSAAGFALCVLGSSTFSTLNIAFAAQLLPNPQRRGRDLGLFNLANTLPSIVGPALAWLLATPRDFSTFMLVLAALMVASGAAITTVRGPS